MKPPQPAMRSLQVGRNPLGWVTLFAYRVLSLRSRTSEELHYGVARAPRHTRHATKPEPAPTNAPRRSVSAGRGVPDGAARAGRGWPGGTPDQAPTTPVARCQIQGEILGRIATPCHGTRWSPVCLEGAGLGGVGLSSLRSCLHNVTVCQSTDAASDQVRGGQACARLQARVCAARRLGQVRS